MWRPHCRARICIYMPRRATTWHFPLLNPFNSFNPFFAMTVEHCANGNEIQRAAAFLDAGQLLAFPPETVYGLGADAQSPAAIARVYALKGRPATYPLIVHLGFNADPAYWIHGAMPRAARVLIDAFWPGPLTLILPRAAHIPAAVSGG